MKREIKKKTHTEEQKFVCEIIANNASRGMVSKKAVESFNRKPYYMTAPKNK